jgi:hypothetical protein
VQGEGLFHAASALAPASMIGKNSRSHRREGGVKEAPFSKFGTVIDKPNVAELRHL